MPATPPVDSFDVNNLSLHETHLLQLALDDVLPFVAEPQYRFKTTCNFLFSADQPELLRVDMHVAANAQTTPTGKSKAATKARLRLNVAFIFHYRGLPVLRQQGALPTALGWTAVSIAYSTLRGLLQARLAGTSFGEAILPIVSPQKLWQPAPPAENSAAG